MDIDLDRASSPRDGGESDHQPTLLDPVTPPTHSYLSTLPANLRPISPYLASLHEARLRLLSTHFRSPIRWCVNCGSLRDTSISQVSHFAGPSSPSPTPKKGRGSPKKSPAKPKASVIGMSCVTCGEKYRRSAKIGAKEKADPAVLASLRPARAVRRTRSDAAAVQTAAAEAMMPISAEMGRAGVEAGLGRQAGHKQKQPVGLSPMPGPPAQAPPEDEPMEPDDTPPFTTSVPESARANPLAAPKLRYIPSTAPSPPTYVQPPAVRPSSSATTGASTSTSSTSSAGAAGGDGAKRKKKKASGLAKLLAQSKEREEELNAGKWGFG